MAIPASPYARVLVQPAGANTTVTNHGNEVVDILSQSWAKHTNLYNISWWAQSGMNCYTPSAHFKAYHSVLDGGNVTEGFTKTDGTVISLPDPDLDGSPYPTVTWRRTSGNNTARTTAPDGSPSIAEVKVMLGGASVGSAWSFQTTHLGAGWDLGLGANKSGMLPDNGAVAFVIHKGLNDTPQEIPDAQPVNFTYDGDPDAVIAALTAQKNAEANAANQGGSGNIRVRVGNIWSVLLPGDNSPPLFQKKIGTANGNPVWETMHTFPAVQIPEKQDGTLEIIVSFAVVKGRICVCVGSKDIASNSYVYSELDPATNWPKTLTFQSAPAIISGINGGFPVWFSLRRIGWNNFAQFLSTLGIQDANTPGVSGAPSIAPDGSFYTIGYTPALSPGMFVQLTKLSPTSLQYAVTLTSTPDDREPCAVSVCYYTTEKLTVAGTAAYVDYGPALTKFQEDCNQPDFIGAGGNRGSSGKIRLTFDIYGLDKIGQENSTDWRSDLAAYVHSSFVLGNLFSDKTVAEVTRMKGYLVNPKQETKGFHDSTYTVELVDDSVRLKAPAGYIDQRYAPISMIKASNPSGVYGYEGVKYILSKAIDQAAADSLQVFMPPDWPTLCDAYLQSTGKIFGSDVPPFMPPYGKDAATFINDLATVDYAALYPAGDTWIYGQFDRIISGLPTINLYDGTNSDGSLESSMADQQITFTMTEAENALDSAYDFNKYVVWGKPPEGAGENDGEKFGVFITSGQVQDSADIASSWERVNLISTGQFYSQAFLNKYLQNLARLNFNKRVGFRGRITLPYAPVYPSGSPSPSLWWGYKVLLNGADDVRFRNMTFRIVKMSITGDMMKKKVTCTLQVAEAI